MGWTAGSPDFRCAQDIAEAGYKYHMNDISAAVGLANAWARSRRKCRRPGVARSGVQSPMAGILALPCRRPIRARRGGFYTVLVEPSIIDGQQRDNVASRQGPPSGAG